MKLSSVVHFSLLQGLSSAQLFSIPCTSTTTLTISGGTSTSIVTATASSNVITTITKSAPVATSTASTTIFSATNLECLGEAVTLTPSPLPISLPFRKEKREAEASLPISLPSLPIPTILPQPTVCPAVPTITIYVPSAPTLPCTEVVATDVQTTVTSTITQNQGTTSTSIVSLAASTTTVTETFVLPTPSAYRGVNYYQYINGYAYAYAREPGGSATAGYGGGGYDTANWNGNYSFYSNGTTREIFLQSENYPSVDTQNCQLPGQATATDCTQWTVVFQGFFHAPHSGNYTAAANGIIDNELIVWGGRKAYRDYTNENSDWLVGMSDPDNKPLSFTYELLAGEFFPMTFIYSNGRGPAKFNITIAGPDGVSYPDDLDLFVPPCPFSPFVP